jgi:hypothetical protein
VNIGTEFGLLTVLYVKKRSNGSVCLCQCVCLTICEIWTSLLTNHRRRTCGQHIPDISRLRLEAVEQDHETSQWKVIPLSKGKFTLVDADDYPDLSQFIWHAQLDTKNGKYYAKRNVRHGLPWRHRGHEPMHRRILKAPDGIQVDHISPDTLDNRRSNLRLATSQQNQFNRGKQRNNTSGYKGVYWLEPYGKFQALIVVKKKHISLGLFTDKIEAAKAYDAAALKYAGAFARLNFPEGF